MSRKTYRVELTEAGRSWLLEFIGRGAAPAREQTRARVLLKADQGPDGPAWPDDQIAEAFELSVGGTKGIRRRFAERGLEGCVKRKKPDREYERKLDGEQEARLVQLACSEAPEGCSQWSLRLLADRLVQLEVVDSISHETVRQTLKKTGSSRIAVANG
jgi:transposase